MTVSRQDGSSSIDGYIVFYGGMATVTPYELALGIFRKTQST